MDTLYKNEAVDDGSPVSVVFRKTEYGIIALFPFIPATVTNGQDECMSYAHIGQHGAADYFHVIAHSHPVDTEIRKERDEQDDLLAELIKIGYTLNVLTHEEVCYEAGYAACKREVEHLIGSPQS
jgi:hypothetical protein